MNPFLRYLADKHSAHRHTDRHTPMTTRPCGLRRAGNYVGSLIKDLFSLVVNFFNRADPHNSKRTYSLFCVFCRPCPACMSRDWLPPVRTCVRWAYYYCLHSSINVTVRKQQQQTRCGCVLGLSMMCRSLQFICLVTIQANQQLPGTVSYNGFLHAL